VEEEVLKLIITIIGVLSMIIKRIFERRTPPKPASEHLKDPSPTVEVIENAEKKAEEKFGPRQ
jgi:hypothetical protein